ncbi:hypothetical protein AVEN_183940-1 [Araneus ventricosus]|uniref:DUF5641 domain-containing protein n=1 Tax=Araneus ventricosus TaxID=182803 RepID=A0A4Y2E0M5_ARAVE|nr:hypothetical protein AVEN_183940-1 [Araneus ventricosus]
MVINHKDSAKYLAYMAKDYLMTFKIEPNDDSKDDLVLIKDYNFPPCKWGQGRIADIIKGTKSKVRVVIVETPTGTIKRGVNKLCVLPMND